MDRDMAEVVSTACVCSSALLATMLGATLASGLRVAFDPAGWEMPSFYYDDDGELQCMCPDEPEYPEDVWEAGSD